MCGVEAVLQQFLHLPQDVVVVQVRAHPEARKTCGTAPSTRPLIITHLLQDQRDNRTFVDFPEMILKPFN